MYVNGRSTFVAADDSPYKYDLDGDGVLESYECELDPATGLPVHEADYTKYKGFQGDVYLYILPEEFRKLISIFTPEPVTLQLLLLLPM